MNNNGKGSGMVLVLILITALLIAFFTLKNMGSLGFAGRPDQTQQEDLVQQAQAVVDQVNKAVQQAEQIT